MNNPIQTPTKNLTCSSRLGDLVGVWLPPRNDEDPIDPEQREAQLRHDRKGSDRARRGDVEGATSRTVAIVLDPGMHGGDVGKSELGGGGPDPVDPSTLRVHQGEAGSRMHGGQGEAGKSRARTQVYPSFTWLGSSDRRESEGVLQVPLSDAVGFAGAQETEADCRLECALELLKRR